MPRRYSEIFLEAACHVRLVAKSGIHCSRCQALSVGNVGAGAIKVSQGQIAIGACAIGLAEMAYQYEAVLTGDGFEFFGAHEPVDIGIKIFPGEPDGFGIDKRKFAVDRAERGGPNSGNSDREPSPKARI